MIYNMMTSESLLLLKFVTHFSLGRGLGGGARHKFFLGGGRRERVMVSQDMLCVSFSCNRK